MSTIQYTIRNIPPNVDRRLRARAKRTGKSFNQTLVEALEGAAGTNKRADNHDFDWFIGSGGLDDNFDKIIEQQRQIDPELWK
jgi:hypothetical protein